LGGFLLINPHAGDERTGAAELAAAAKERGVQTHVLRPGEDAADLARAADVEVVGVAGGDGSLAPVAQIALETKRAFVCVPFGTRNHFARDLGLEREDPVAALDAFAGHERRIDVGRVNGRIFLNNVSFGVYASLVHRRERHRRRRELLARVRALLRTLRHPHRLRVSVDGDAISARVILVANNGYELQLFELGARPSLEEGRLHVYTMGALMPRAWDERSGAAFTIDAPGRLRAAVDGEPAELDPPLRFSIEPRALRVLLPREPSG
jgi:diacylglycerol kinase family enzyme